MGFAAQPPTPLPHPYSQATRLYQAFIFPIPIFCFMFLVLLFYLFYLKRRTPTFSPPLTLPISSHVDPFTSAKEKDLKGDLKDKLPTILFDEGLKEKDSMCCVCLGEFEMEEELHQIPTCKHLFHVECLRSWLSSNPTCPLCRGIIFTAIDHSHSKLSENPQIGSAEPQELAREYHPVIIEGSSSARSSSATCSADEILLAIPSMIENPQIGSAKPQILAREHHIAITEGSSSGRSSSATCSGDEMM
ncbi:hypothetical protein NMG60_11030571 [Bertholletia excelsa]